MILVAHDRWFLEAVTTAVLELDARPLDLLPRRRGTSGAARRRRALHATKSIARYDADIARLQRFVDRFRYKKSKAKQAQAKLTQIGRLKKERGAATARSHCSRGARGGSASSS